MTNDLLSQKQMTENVKGHKCSDIWPMTDNDKIQMTDNKIDKWQLTNNENWHITNDI